MFTGIITDLGQVHRLQRGTGPEGGCELTIATAYPVDEIALGASIACSGPCLTVIAIEPGLFTVEASAETLGRTTLGEWTEGTPVNLERALRLGDELGGHLVSGHVDGVAQLVERRPEGDSIRFTIEAPAELARYIAPKGSVALDGVSLTVNEVEGGRFGVNIIPYTLAHTSLGEARPGQRLNLEIDTIARYVARLLDVSGAERTNG
jgi:riboflavin synthase